MFLMKLVRRNLVQKILSQKYSKNVLNSQITSEEINKIDEIDKSKAKLHEPVLLDQILKYLVEDNPTYKTFIDMTFGAGGHTEAILKRNTQSKIFTLDRDPLAIQLASELSSKYSGRIIPLSGKFSEISNLLEENNVTDNTIDAALIDAGVSSMQFDTAERGFSISKNGPLDMRMNPTIDTITAADLVNRLDEKSLSRIICKYGEEKMHKKIAHGIVYFRSAHGKIETTQQLADVISTTVGIKRFDSLNRPTGAATKTFQALRIFVNNELNELYNGISQLHRFLKPGGRLAVISFHSLEDRIVKNHFNNVDVKTLEASYSDETHKSRSGLKKKQRSDLLFEMNKNANLEMDKFNKSVVRPWTPLDKKIILPTHDEIETNPRARSAKLRIAIKN